MKNMSENLNFIETPNLPAAPVKLVLIDGRADHEIEYSLRELGIDIIKTDEHPELPEALAFHPDMQFCHLGGNELVYAPGTSEKTLGRLGEYGFTLISGSTTPSGEYPNDIPYNVAIVGKLAIHDFRYTDPIIKERLDKKGIEQVNVRQGYSKCSIAVIGPGKIMTADRGIFNSTVGKGIDVLLLDAETSITLDGYEHGFIGGCTGLIDIMTLAITGDSRELAQFKKISEHLMQNNITLINLGKGKPVDIGSIIPLMTI